MFVPGVHKWILSVILALEGAVVTPASEATQESAPVFVDPVDGGSESQVSLATGRALALGELQQALRILGELEYDSSHAFTNYVRALQEICARYRKLDGLGSSDLASALHALAADLAASIVNLETEIDDIRTWRRVAHAIEPDAVVIRIPRRFVRRTAALPETEGWSEVDHGLWG